MKKGKLIILVGASGSGKSTWAKDNQDENTIIVGRDKIRELLSGYTESNINEYYHRKDLNKLEKIVTQYIDNSISFFLRQGKNIIVDNTHLKKSYIDEYNKYDCDKEIKVFWADFKTLLERQNNRIRKVDKSIIKNQYNQIQVLLTEIRKIHVNEDLIQQGELIFTLDYPFKTTHKKVTQNKKLNKAIICDIDGCLAKMKDRSPYDWSRVGEDEVQEHIRNLVNLYYLKGYKVFIFTGRDGSCYNLTKSWLHNNGILFDYLYSRKEGDQRKDSIIKEELFRNHVLDEFYVELVIDDRVSVKQMWVELGLNVLSNNPLGYIF